MMFGEKPDPNQMHPESDEQDAVEPQNYVNNENSDLMEEAPPLQKWDMGSQR